VLKFAERWTRIIARWSTLWIVLAICVLVVMRSEPVRCCVPTPRARATAGIVSIVGAVMEYSLNHDGVFPGSLEELVTPDEQGWRYLNSKTVPLDPWGRAYFYRPPSLGEPTPIVFSFGRDGEFGGEDLDADIDSITMCAR
jgi:general secretion pathway protein G